MAGRRVRGGGAATATCPPRRSAGLDPLRLAPSGLLAPTELVPCGGRTPIITVVIFGMALAHSKLTAQGQISVPAKVRQKLGVGPGSVLEWDDAGDHVVVRKAGRYTSEDIHRAVFPRRPKPRTVTDMKEGIRRHIKRKHASR